MGAGVAEGAGKLDALFATIQPDLNPIEMACSKLKAHLRRMAARTFDALTEAWVTSAIYSNLKVRKLLQSCKLWQ